MVLAITAMRNLEVHQIYVKIVFLNGDLDEKICMKQLDFFSSGHKKRSVN